MRFFIFIFLILSNLPLWAQKATIAGTVVNQHHIPIEGVNIKIEIYNIGTSTNARGEFKLEVPAGNIEATFLHINYNITTARLTLAAGEIKNLHIVLEERIETLDQIEIFGETEIQIRSQASLLRLSPKAVKALPTPFGEFNKILSTLPGVVGQNEFSSAYMVRGGNFDENLVYVNDIPIYRPFLVRSGQQEGLSFVNTDLVGSVGFSSGGWQPRYGDKLSSSLNIEYKRPTRFDASLSAGLLGGTAHVEGLVENAGIKYLVGIRHKQWKYLLNTLETHGKYQPNFTDAQAFFNFDLSKRGGISKRSSSEVDLLMSYAHNRYNVIPESRETTLGNIFTDILKLYVGFEGKEVLEYNTYQVGTKFTHRFNPRVKNALIVSGFNTREREYFDVEGFYRLCDVDKRPGSETYNQCLSIRGTGTNYNHGRNRLEANLINVENQLSLLVGSSSKIEIGAGFNHSAIDDYLREFSFIDSADYVTIDESISSDNTFAHNQYTAYFQNTQNLIGGHVVTYGARFHYHDLNGQFLTSPRLQYAYHPGWTADWVFKFAAGLYRQPPFYREFRDRSGNLNTKIKAQSSLHFIVGIDHHLKIWDRDFKLVSEAYHKYLYDVIPYDVDNVRIRYMATNMAKAYAWGMDFRLSGEFIPGTDSWFSVGVLSTREDIENDGKGYIRRPTDQRVMVSMFLEDHFQNDPTMRMNLNLQFGTGLPFGPPYNPALRNALQGDYYARVDIGFSKMLASRKEVSQGGVFNHVWLGVEILNLLANENIISYTWVKDFNNVQYGVPNSLSSRFFNVKLTVN
jgi:hypothetical protein